MTLKESSSYSTLLDVSAISLHQIFYNQEIINKNPLIKELVKLNYPLKSINSMIKCGELQGEFIQKCDCGTRLKQLKHNCNLRTCYSCSKIRCRRLSKLYTRYLKLYPKTRTKRLRFLTISPSNYSDLEFGLKDIRKNFNKFVRRKYIKENVDGGIYVIEAKATPENTWNLHLHVILYSKFISNYPSEEGDSILVKEWKDTSKCDVVIDIKQVCQQKKGVKELVDYLLKYVTAFKDEFYDVKQHAFYISCTRKKKLINLFGDFFNNRPKKHDSVCICKKCGVEVEFIFDYQLVDKYKLELSSLTKPT